jgi:uncharacterized protein DUF4375
VLDDADHIWNRACDPFAEFAAAGDRALQALLLVHGQVRNGGLDSALEYQSPQEIHNAIGGLRYFGLGDAARSIETAFEVTFEARDIDDPSAREEHLDRLSDSAHERLERLHDDYIAAVPRDEVLEIAFRQRLRESPGDFEPLV